MFMVNTHGWDYPLVAALVAPRPLMIGNSDNDNIFPKDGVQRLYRQVKRVYELYGAGDNVTLHMTEGGHSDTPELRRAAFAWMNRHLKGQETASIDDQAEKLFKPQDLKVFDALPNDAVNAEIHEAFVSVAPQPKLPESPEQWTTLCESWRDLLPKQCFAGWPQHLATPEVTEIAAAEHADIRLTVYEFASQPAVRLRIYLLSHVRQRKAEEVVLTVVDEQAWQQLLACLRAEFKDALREELLSGSDETGANQLHDLLRNKPAASVAFFAPRGIGCSAWGGNAFKQRQIRRRFMLLGQTLDGMRVWDVRRAIQAVRKLDACEGTRLSIRGKRQAGVLALYASLFEPGVVGIRLEAAPPDQREGPIFLNIARHLRLPQVVASAATRSDISLVGQTPASWAYPVAVARSLGWDNSRVQISAKQERE
jgi:hypothetical protein